MSKFKTVLFQKHSVYKLQGLMAEVKEKKKNEGISTL